MERVLDWIRAGDIELKRRNISDASTQRAMVSACPDFQIWDYMIYCIAQKILETHGHATTSSFYYSKALVELLEHFILSWLWYALEDCAPPSPLPIDSSSVLVRRVTNYNNNNNNNNNNNTYILD